MTYILIAILRLVIVTTKSRKGKRIIPRTVSIVLILSFLLQQIAYAAPSPVIASDAKQSLPLSFTLPSSIGFVEDSYQGQKGKAKGKFRTSEKKIYLIQDAHTNESGQINIAKILEILLKKEQINYVFLEAGTGNASLSFLRQRAPLKERKRVALSFLRKGLLQGSEYLDLTSDLEFVLWGVENEKLYEKAIQGYRSNVQSRDKFKSIFSKIQSALSVLKPVILNERLLEFDQKTAKLHSGLIALTDYFRFLVQESKTLGLGLEDYPNLKRLVKLQAKEQKIDFEKASEQQNEALNSLPEEVQRELLKASKENRSLFKLTLEGHKEKEAFYTMLESSLRVYAQQRTLVGPPEAESNLYLELYKYFDYIKASKKLNFKAILKEQEYLEKAILQKLIQTEDEERLTAIQRSVTILKKIAALQASPDEVREFNQNLQIHDVTYISGFLNRKMMDLKKFYEKTLFLNRDLETLLNEASDFYELTFKRDEAFIQNMFKKMETDKQQNAVLITGGYHTPNLKKILKDRGVSFVSVSPQVLHESDQKRYERLLLSQKIGGDSSIQLTSRNTQDTDSVMVRQIFFDDEKMRLLESSFATVNRNIADSAEKTRIRKTEKHFSLSGARLFRRFINRLEQGRFTRYIVFLFRWLRYMIRKSSVWNNRHVEQVSPHLRLHDFQTAYDDLKESLERTPLVRARRLSNATHREIFVKDEARQRSGSFKARGVFHEILVAILTLAQKARKGDHIAREKLQKGVQIITQTDGNHGIALIEGVTSVVTLLSEFYDDVDPELAGFIRKIEPIVYTISLERLPEEKRYIMQGVLAAHQLIYGNDNGQIAHFESYEDAADARREHVESMNGRALYMDHGGREIMIGHGSAGLEIAEQLQEMGIPETKKVAVILPVGAGGPIGIGAALKAARPNTTAVMVQSEDLGAFHQTLKRSRPGRIRMRKNSKVFKPSIAVTSDDGELFKFVFPDGIAVDRPEDYWTVEVAQQVLDASVIVLDVKAFNETGAILFADLKDHYAETVDMPDEVRIGGTTAITAEALRFIENIPALKDADVIVLFATEGNVPQVITDHYKKLVADDSRVDELVGSFEKSAFISGSRPGSARRISSRKTRIAGTRAATLLKGVSESKGARAIRLTQFNLNRWEVISGLDRVVLSVNPSPAKIHKGKVDPNYNQTKALYESVKQDDFDIPKEKKKEYVTKVVKKDSHVMGFFRYDLVNNELVAIAVDDAQSGIEREAVWQLLLLYLDREAREMHPQGYFTTYLGEETFYGNAEQYAAEELSLSSNANFVSHEATAHDLEAAVQARDRAREAFAEAQAFKETSDGPSLPLSPEEIQVRRRNLVEAEVNIDSALEVAPGFTPDLIFAARVHEALGDFDQALMMRRQLNLFHATSDNHLAFLRTLRRAINDTIPDKTWVAVRKQSETTLLNAERYLEESLRFAPNDILDLILLSRVKEAQGKLVEVLWLRKRVYKIQPSQWHRRNFYSLLWRATRKLSPLYRNLLGLRMDLNDEIKEEMSAVAEDIGVHKSSLFSDSWLLPQNLPRERKLRVPWKNLVNAAKSHNTDQILEALQGLRSVLNKIQDNNLVKVVKENNTLYRHVMGLNMPRSQDVDQTLRLLVKEIAVDNRLELDNQWTGTDPPENELRTPYRQLVQAVQSQDVKAVQSALQFLMQRLQYRKAYMRLRSAYVPFTPEPLVIQLRGDLAEDARSADKEIMVRVIFKHMKTGEEITVDVPSHDVNIGSLNEDNWTLDLTVHLEPDQIFNEPHEIFSYITIAQVSEDQGKSWTSSIPEDRPSEKPHKGKVVVVPQAVRDPDPNGLLEDELRMFKAPQREALAQTAIRTLLNRNQLTGIKGEHLEEMQKSLEKSFECIQKTGAFVASQDGYPRYRYFYNWLRDGFKYAQVLMKLYRLTGIEELRQIVDAHIDYILTSDANVLPDAQRLTVLGSAPYDAKEDVERYALTRHPARWGEEPIWANQDDGPAHAIRTALDYLKITDASFHPPIKAYILRTLQYLLKTAFSSSRDLWEEIDAQHHIYSSLLQMDVLKDVLAYEDLISSTEQNPLTGEPLRQDLETALDGLGVLLISGHEDSFVKDDQGHQVLRAHVRPAQPMAQARLDLQKPDELESSSIGGILHTSEANQTEWMELAGGIPTLVGTLRALDHTFLETYPIHQTGVLKPTTVLWGRYSKDAYNGDPVSDYVTTEANPWVLTSLWRVQSLVLLEKHILKGGKPVGDYQEIRDYVSGLVSLPLNTVDEILEALNHIIHTSMDDLIMLNDKPGIFAEQIDRYNGDPRGVTPLVWSQWEYVHTMLAISSVHKQLEKSRSAGARLVEKKLEYASDETKFLERIIEDVLDINEPTAIRITALGDYDAERLNHFGFVTDTRSVKKAKDTLIASLNAKNVESVLRRGSSLFIYLHSSRMVHLEMKKPFQDYSASFRMIENLNPNAFEALRTYLKGGQVEFASLKIEYPLRLEKPADKTKFIKEVKLRLNIELPEEIILSEEEYKKAPKPSSPKSAAAPTEPVLTAEELKAQEFVSWFSKGVIRLTGHPITQELFKEEKAQERLRTLMSTVEAEYLAGNHFLPGDEGEVLREHVRKALELLKNQSKGRFGWRSKDIVREIFSNPLVNFYNRIERLTIEGAGLTQAAKLLKDFKEYNAVCNSMIMLFDGYSMSQSQQSARVFPVVNYLNSYAILLNQVSSFMNDIAAQSGIPFESQTAGLKGIYVSTETIKVDYVAAAPQILEPLEDLEATLKTIAGHYDEGRFPHLSKTLGLLYGLSGDDAGKLRHALEEELTKPKTDNENTLHILANVSRLVGERLGALYEYESFFNWSENRPLEADQTGYTLHTQDHERLFEISKKIMGIFGTSEVMVGKIFGISRRQKNRNGEGARIVRTKQTAAQGSRLSELDKKSLKEFKAFDVRALLKRARQFRILERSWDVSVFETKTSNFTYLLQHDKRRDLLKITRFRNTDTRMKGKKERVFSLKNRDALSFDESLCSVAKKAGYFPAVNKVPLLRQMTFDDMLDVISYGDLVAHTPHNDTLERFEVETPNGFIFSFYHDQLLKRLRVVRYAPTQDGDNARRDSRLFYRVEEAVTSAKYDEAVRRLQLKALRSQVFHKVKIQDQNFFAKRKIDKRILEVIKKLEDDLQIGKIDKITVKDITDQEGITESGLYGRMGRSYQIKNAVRKLTLTEAEVKILNVLGVLLAEEVPGKDATETLIAQAGNFHRATMQTRKASAKYNFDVSHAMRQMRRIEEVDYRILNAIYQNQGRGRRFTREQIAKHAQIDLHSLEERMDINQWIRELVHRAEEGLKVRAPLVGNPNKEMRQDVRILRVGHKYRGQSKDARYIAAKAGVSLADFRKRQSSNRRLGEFLESNVLGSGSRVSRVVAGVLPFWISVDKERNKAVHEIKFIVSKGGQTHEFTVDVRRPYSEHAEGTLVSVTAFLLRQFELEELNMKKLETSQDAERIFKRILRKMPAIKNTKGWDVIINHDIEPLNQKKVFMIGRIHRGETQTPPAQRDEHRKFFVTETTDMDSGRLNIQILHGRDQIGDIHANVKLNHLGNVTEIRDIDFYLQLDWQHQGIMTEAWRQMGLVLDVGGLMRVPLRDAQSEFFLAQYIEWALVQLAESTDSELRTIVRDAFRLKASIIGDLRRYANTFVTHKARGDDIPLDRATDEFDFLTRIYGAGGTFSEPQWMPVHRNDITSRHHPLNDSASFGFLRSGLVNFVHDFGDLLPIEPHILAATSPGKLMVAAGISPWDLTCQAHIIYQPDPDEIHGTAELEFIARKTMEKAENDPRATLTHSLNEREVIVERLMARGIKKNRVEGTLESVGTVFSETAILAKITQIKSSYPTTVVGLVSYEAVPLKPSAPASPVYLTLHREDQRFLHPMRFRIDEVSFLRMNLGGLGSSDYELYQLNDDDGDHFRMVLINSQGGLYLFNLFSAESPNEAVAMPLVTIDGAQHLPYQILEHHPRPYFAIQHVDGRQHLLVRSPEGQNIRFDLITGHELSGTRSPSDKRIRDVIMQYMGRAQTSAINVHLGFRDFQTSDPNLYDKSLQLASDISVLMDELETAIQDDIREENVSGIDDEAFLRFINEASESAEKLGDALDPTEGTSERSLKFEEIKNNLRYLEGILSTLKSLMRYFSLKPQELNLQLEEIPLNVLKDLPAAFNQLAVKAGDPNLLPEYVSLNDLSQAIYHVSQDNYSSLAFLSLIDSIGYYLLFSRRMIAMDVPPIESLEWNAIFSDAILRLETAKSIADYFVMEVLRGDDDVDDESVAGTRKTENDIQGSLKPRALAHLKQLFERGLNLDEPVAVSDIYSDADWTLSDADSGHNIRPGIAQNLAWFLKRGVQARIITANTFEADPNREPIGKPVEKRIVQPILDALGIPVAEVGSQFKVSARSGGIKVSYDGGQKRVELPDKDFTEDQLQALGYQLASALFHEMERELAVNLESYHAELKPGLRIEQIESLIDRAQIEHRIKRGEERLQFDHGMIFMTFKDNALDFARILHEAENSRDWTDLSDHPLNFFGGPYYGAASVHSKAQEVRDDMKHQQGKGVYLGMGDGTDDLRFLLAMQDSDKLTFPLYVGGEKNLKRGDVVIHSADEDLGFVNGSEMMLGELRKAVEENKTYADWPFIQNKWSPREAAEAYGMSPDEFRSIVLDESRWSRLLSGARVPLTAGLDQVPQALLETPGSEFSKYVIGEHKIPIAVYSSSTRTQLYKTYDTGELTANFTLESVGLTQQLKEENLTYPALESFFKLVFVLPPIYIFNWLLRLHSDHVEDVVSRFINPHVPASSRNEIKRLLGTLKGAIDKAGAISGDMAVQAIVNHLAGDDEEFAPLLGYVNHVIENKRGNTRFERHKGWKSVKDVQDIQKLELWWLKEGNTSVVSQVKVYLKDRGVVKLAVNVARDLTEATKKLKTVYENMEEDFDLYPFDIAEPLGFGVGKALGIRRDVTDQEAWVAVPLLVVEWVDRPENDDHYVEPHAYDASGHRIHLWRNNRTVPGHMRSIQVSDQIWYDFARIRSIYSRIAPDGRIIINSSRINAGDLVIGDDSPSLDQEHWDVMMSWSERVRARRGFRGELNETDIVLFTLLIGALDERADQNARLVFWRRPDLGIQAIEEGTVQRNLYRAKVEANGQPINEAEIRQRSIGEVRELLETTLTDTLPAIMDDPAQIPDWDTLDDVMRQRFKNQFELIRKALTQHLHPDDDPEPVTDGLSAQDATVVLDGMLGGLKNQQSVSAIRDKVNEVYRNGLSLTASQIEAMVQEEYISGSSGSRKTGDIVVNGQTHPLSQTLAGTYSLSRLFQKLDIRPAEVTRLVIYLGKQQIPVEGSLSDSGVIVNFSNHAVEITARGARLVPSGLEKAPFKNRLREYLAGVWMALGTPAFADEAVIPLHIHGTRIAQLRIRLQPARGNETALLMGRTDLMPEPIYIDDPRSNSGDTILNSSSFELSIVSPESEELRNKLRNKGKQRGRRSRIGYHLRRFRRTSNQMDEFA